MRINQGDDEIHILYDIKAGWKNYSDPKHRIKSRKFSVRLLFSSDGGKTFKNISNASGDIGDAIAQGNNKKIIYKPLKSQYGLIGRFFFKIEATPNIPKLTWGLSYSYGFYELLGYADKNNFSKVEFTLIHPLKGNGSLIFPLSFSINHNATSLFIWSHTNDQETETIDETINWWALSTGVGFQTNKRLFSFIVSAGIGSLKKQREITIEHENGTLRYENESLSSPTMLIDVETNVKLFDLRGFTILLPIGIYFEMMAHNSIFLYAGLTVLL